MARTNPEPNVSLYNLRDIRGESQEQVADGLQALAIEQGRPVATTGNDISRWERGIVRPGPWNRQLLAEYYGVSVDELGLTRQRPAPVHSSGHLAGPGLQFLDLDHQDDIDPDVAESQQQWLTIRRATHGRQPALARLAAQLYPEATRIDDTGMLTRPEWTPEVPVPLEHIEIAMDPSPPVPVVDGAGDDLRHILPLAADGRRFTRYSYAIRELARPSLFENRPCWRLTGAEIGNGRSRMTFTDMNYFDAIDIAEAVAHETVAGHLINEGELAPPTWRGQRFRKAIGDPLDLTRRPFTLSINTLTIRRDRHSAAMVLHDRSTSKVATAGGIVTAIPCGVFQPSTVRSVDHTQDFDIWRNIIREYSEEFLGNAEHGGDEAGADYTAEPLASLDRARQEGKIRVYAIGIRVGALDLWNSLETVAVIDGDAFDELFLNAVTTNDEGTLVQTGTNVPSILIPFTQATINELFATDRLAGETRFNLDRCWRHRDLLLG